MKSYSAFLLYHSYEYYNITRVWLSTLHSAHNRYFQSVQNFMRQQYIEADNVSFRMAATAIVSFCRVGWNVPGHNSFLLSKIYPTDVWSYWFLFRLFVCIMVYLITLNFLVSTMAEILLIGCFLRHTIQSNVLCFNVSSLKCVVLISFCPFLNYCEIDALRHHFCKDGFICLMVICVYKFIDCWLPTNLHCFMQIKYNVAWYDHVL